jgi:transcription initiation factor TFIID subunit 4
MSSFFLQAPQQQNNTSSIQKVVINQPGLRPGQPGSQITVPLSTLQALQAGQGIPTGQPGHLLVKTETGQYQILRVGPPGQPMVPAAATPSTVASSPMVMQHQQTAAAARLPSVPSPVQVLRHQMPVTTAVRVPLPPQQQQQQAVVRTPTAVVTAAAQAPSPAAAQAK